MERVFVKDIKINEVRHLNNINIHVSEGDVCKHIILTGKNGSGKTSVLDSVACFLDAVTTGKNPSNLREQVKRERCQFEKYQEEKDEYYADLECKNLHNTEKRLQQATAGVWLEFNNSYVKIKKLYDDGQFVVAYYKADRVFSSVEPKHVEKVQLKKGYTIEDTPRNEFIKYLLDLKMTQALAATNGKKNKASSISLWFDKFEELLKKIFADDSVKLCFDEDTFKFSIEMDGRQPFDFNTLSSGYAAVLDIVVDLIIRMENQTNRTFDFNIPGVVLIDEIETHLHLELQKNVMKLLTTVFPNIQFVVSSHSPFILNSLDNAVIFDLESKTFVKDGLADVPYSGIVEGYFNADELSDELREKFDTYKKLALKKELNADDYEQIADLELYLDEIPDYLALNLTTEYKGLKAKLREREEQA